MLDKVKKFDLLKYGRHLRSCELVLQPFSGSTDSHWSCNCGFSKALDCGLCDSQGYVINLELSKGGYLTGFCPACGLI